MSGAAPSRWRDVGRRFWRQPGAKIATGVLCTVVFLAAFGPWLSPHAVDQIDFDADWSQSPTLVNSHWFGTDSLGRDLFVRTLEGGRVSLAIGLAATLLSLVVGVAWGAVAGYRGGRLDALLMRTVDVLYALPFVFLVMLLMAIFGREPWLMLAAIAAVSWLDLARISRGQALALRGQDFIAAARLAGLGSSDIVRRHVIPNLLGVVAVYGTLMVPQVILLESFLSFLGLGVQEPATSWGVLVSDGAREMEEAPWSLLFPAGFLALTLYAFNALGDALRDALDPRGSGW